MPVARYWRIVGIETYAGGDLELSELHLYGASGRLDATATLTSTITPTAGTLAALQDDNLGTPCRFAAAAVRAGGFALAWDFGAGNTANAVGVRLGASVSQAEFMARCTLHYSTDGAQWVWFGDFSRYAWPGVGAYTIAPAVGDPSYLSVSLLLHCDGADGSTAFTDSSAAPRVFTAYNGAAVSTAQSKFGGSSLALDGSNDYIQAPASSAFAFPGDFTFEFWAWKSANGTGGFDIAVTTDTSNGSAINGWLLELSSSRGFVFAADGQILIAYSTNPNDSAWHHWAISREGSTLRAFRDGVLVATATSSLSILATGPLGVGGNQNLTSYPFKGYIDELRITKGEAHYTANFTPPPDEFSESAGGAGGTVFETPTVHIAGSAAKITASAPVPTHCTRPTAPLQLACDIEHGDQGAIYGTTKTKGTPNTSTKARVVLLHQRSKLPVREVWSDPVTGYFEFRGIDTAQQFIVLAEDVDGNFRPVAANRLTPEVLP